jgi:hypothetical protein
MKYAKMDTRRTLAIRQNHMELIFDCTATRTFDGTGAWEIKTQDRTFRVNAGHRRSPWKKAEEKLRRLVFEDHGKSMQMRPLIKGSCKVLGR